MLLCARRQVGGLLLVARNTLIALALLPIVGHLQAGGTMPAASAAALAAGLQVSLTPVVASRPDRTALAAGRRQRGAHGGRPDGQWRQPRLPVPAAR